ncbi:MAG: putative lipid II flippase FtsW [Verrucomicrobiota bacterium]
MKIVTTILIFCVAALIALGMVMLYSASMTQKGTHYLMMQLLWCALGVGAFAGTLSLDYHVWKRVSLVLFGLACVLLCLVFVPVIGLKINGAHRWLNLSPLRFQPSELAKLAVIIALAHYAERYRRRLARFKFGVLIPGAALAVVLGLILAGRDYGTTMLIGAVSAMLLLVAGVRWSAFLPVVLLVCLGLGAAIWSNPVRRARVMAWLYPEQHMDGTGYQTYQGIIALGSGGAEGLGLGDSRQKLGFVPEHHTDFILTIIGEELGIVATLGIVLGYLVILACGMFIAWRASDDFGTFLAAGITLLVCLQAFINIGVVTDVLPNKGLPLPFISYGGSSLLVMLASMGILLSVARQAGGTVNPTEDALANEPIPITPVS